jgi:hypothetical protein
MPAIKILIHTNNPKTKICTMKAKQTPLQKGQQMFIQQPHGRCMVLDTEKAQLIRSITEESANHQHLWYIGFGTANSQVKVIKCFESVQPEQLHFPCKEVVNFAIINGYTDFFAVRTHLHGAAICYELEQSLVQQAQDCCRISGLKISDYIVLKPGFHVVHALRQQYVMEWQQKTA